MVRKRFSLKALLLGVIFIAMALTIVVLSVKLIPLQEEVQLLRREAGVIDVSDPTQIHLVNIDTNHPLLWKWKVWIPPNWKHLGIHSQVRYQNSNDEQESWLAFQTAGQRGPLEIEITATIYKLGDKWFQETKATLGGWSTSEVIELVLPNELDPSHIRFSSPRIAAQHFQETSHPVLRLPLLEYSLPTSLPSESHEPVIISVHLDPLTDAELQELRQSMQRH